MYTNKAAATNQPDDFLDKSSALVAVRSGTGWPFDSSNTAPPHVFLFWSHSTRATQHPPWHIRPVTSRHRSRRQALQRSSKSRHRPLHRWQRSIAAPGSAPGAPACSTGSTGVLLHCSHVTKNVVRYSKCSEVYLVWFCASSQMVMLVAPLLDSFLGRLKTAVGTIVLLTSTQDYIEHSFQGNTE
jgi:hypothetical protein